jgi:diguanylate cyclase (GGDEF)-like protein
MGNMYGTARELMQLRRGLPGPDGLPAELPWSETSGPVPDHILSSDEILAALDRLRDSGDGGPDEDRSGLTRRLTRVIEGAEGPARALSAEARDALEVVDGLIGSIRSDAYVPESAKGWFDQLEVTFGKLATEDVDFLDTSAEPIHPALELLNELAELGTAADAGEGIDPALRRQVDAIVSRAAGDYDGDDSVFTTALEALRPLATRQRTAFEGNLKRVVRQSEGASRLVDARRAVVRSVGEQLGGREIPEPLLRLLNPGWRNLLVHNLLRHGPDSAEFTRNLELVDELAAAIDSGSGDAGNLIGEIAGGLDNIAYEPGRRRQLIESLERALIDGAAAPRVTVEADEVADLLGLSDVLPETAPVPASDDAGERRRWNECLETARGIDVGAWLGIDDDVGRTRILSVAWIGEDHAAFTLVNRKGVKVHDLELRDMVQGLVDDRIQLIDEMDMPLMERASRTMLQNMHNQLAYQATHDALTGLVNRKEYERTVDRVIRDGERADSGGAVMFMDLDQFKIINNTSGHDAGDELLRAIVPSLRHQLRSIRGTLARLGGDEFGVLIERCDADRAREIAEALLRAVREFRFEWDGKEYALTGSIGLVVFQDSSRSAAMLLQQADSACYAAKDGGRNRVLVFELEDEGLARRRGVMEWVAKVDQVVRDDRILLTAQKIAPVVGGPGAMPHYEILMRVLDEDGRPMPPIDFITAAETYDRMPSVDRWVVGHALEWMAGHRDLLERVHGFSINLSGTSLNDPGFLDFVVRTIEETGVPPGKVTFEITETAAVSSMDGANRFIARLRELGCTFSLDDFGTGLSSYSYLRNLDVDYVKIDGVFVKDMVDSPADYAVVRSVNEVAHFMGKQTIAEFVETEAILDALAEIGVDYAQGWGVGKPAPLADFDDD